MYVFLNMRHEKDLSLTKYRSKWEEIETSIRDIQHILTQYLQLGGINKV